jgi:hypothetical protein
MCQLFIFLHFGDSNGYATALTHDKSVGRVYEQKCLSQYHHYLHTINVNRMSTIFCLAFWTIKVTLDVIH